jgi:hypothetical protein
MATAARVSNEDRVYDRPKRLRGSATVKAPYSDAACAAVFMAGSLLR